MAEQQDTTVVEITSARKRRTSKPASTSAKAPAKATRTRRASAAKKATASPKPKATTTRKRAKRPEVGEGQRFCGRCETVKAFPKEFPVRKNGKAVGWCFSCQKAYRAEVAAKKKEAAAPKA